MPAGKPGRRWTNEAFADDCHTNERAVRFWRRGTHLPNDLGAIEAALFGDKPTDTNLRQALRDAYDLAKARRSNEPDQSAKQPTPAQLGRPDRCLGRETETTDLLAALTDRRNPAVLVLGGPGIGKTTLTRQVATSDALDARFANRRWFVELETATDAASLRTAIVQALGLAASDPNAFTHALARLRQAPSLLVLDNLETPWEADMAPVHNTLRQLAALPDLALLASLRGNERPDAPAWTHTTRVQPLPRTASRELFLTIADQVSPDDPQLEDFLEALGDAARRRTRGQTRRTQRIAHRPMERMAASRRRTGEARPPARRPPPALAAALDRPLPAFQPPA
jgi:hypothetical protein